MPMAEKTIDMPTLTKSESFLLSLSDKIDKVINYENKEELIFDLPGRIYIDAREDQIYYSVLTQGTIYSSNSSICLTRSCASVGTFGEEKFYFGGVSVSSSLSGRSATNTYYLRFRNLTCKGSLYNIDLITYGNSTLVGEKDTKLIIRNLGRQIENIGGGKRITIKIGFNLSST